MNMYIVFYEDNREVMRLTSSDYSAIELYDMYASKGCKLMSCRYNKLKNYIYETEYSLKVRDLTEEEKEELYMGVVSQDLQYKNKE